MTRQSRAREIPDERRALNNAETDHQHEVARSREQQTVARAQAEAASRGRTADVAPAPALGDDRELERAIASGAVTVVIPERKKPPHHAFGPEVQLLRGTMVRADGTPCPAGEAPFGVVGNIQTADGLLVNRIIPFDALVDDAIVEPTGGGAS